MSLGPPGNFACFFHPRDLRASVNHTLSVMLIFLKSLTPTSRSINSSLMDSNFMWFSSPLKRGKSRNPFGNMQAWAYPVAMLKHIFLASKTSTYRRMSLIILCETKNFFGVYFTEPLSQNDFGEVAKAKLRLRIATLASYGSCSVPEDILDVDYATSGKLPDESDVFLFPTGMSAIWHAHRMTLSCLTGLKPVCYGWARFEACSFLLTSLPVSHTLILIEYCKNGTKDATFMGTIQTIILHLSKHFL